MHIVILKTPASSSRVRDMEIETDPAALVQWLRTREHPKTSFAPSLPGSPPVKEPLTVIQPWPRGGLNE